MSDFIVLLIFAGAMAMHQPEEGSKEEVIPELGNCSFRILPSESVLYSHGF